MEFGSEDPEGPSLSTFFCFITRDVEKTHSNLYFRSVQIVEGSPQVPITISIEVEHMSC